MRQNALYLSSFCQVGFLRHLLFFNDSALRAFFHREIRLTLFLYISTEVAPVSAFLDCDLRRRGVRTAPPAGRSSLACTFVDTPEAETACRDRIDEQAAYFGITREQAVTIAHEASAFTKKDLAEPFTVWTRWRSALGRSSLRRVYHIAITADGRDLNELLIENGLARIYDTKTALPDGQNSRAYLANLKKIEAKTKAGSRGGSRFRRPAISSSVVDASPAKGKKYLIRAVKSW